MGSDLFLGLATSLLETRNNGCDMRLTFAAKVACSAPAFTLAVVGIPVYGYIPKFYPDGVGVHIGVLGFLLPAVRLFDAVTDPLLILSCRRCVAALRERVVREYRSRQPLLQGSSAMMQNRPFVLLLGSCTVAAFGSNLPATLILHDVEYVLESKQADFFLVLYFVTGIVFLPAWVLLSRRIGKKRAWIASMAINTGAFVRVFFPGPGDAPL